MTELSALAGSEGYAARDDEASVELSAFGGQPRRRAQRRSPSAAHGTHEVQNAFRGRGGAAK